MKYSTEIIINLPRERVIELFDSVDNMSKWMKGLQSFEHLSGTPSEVGAKSLLKFKMGKRDLEMVETITVKNLPDEFSAIYEAKGVWNAVKNKFADLGDGNTLYSAEHEFRLSGFMKLFGVLMPGVFKKQSQKYLVDFKTFAEAEG